MSYSASSSFSSSDNTYEATRARQLKLPDRIHWNSALAFRNQPYRLLHHQKGTIGNFRIQLLEAADLKRSYWSALAMGPVKHLGLSKAHGKVSSYCEFSMATFGSEAKTPSILATSPVVPSNDNPVWHNCEYNVELKKGALPDGSRTILQIAVLEDASAAENFVPVMVPSPEDRLLGRGEIDMTELLLGDGGESARQSVGVLDSWIPIYREQQDGSVCDTGRVRVLISYKPNGQEPQENDVVALEAFARRSVTASSCTAILPPLQPLKVLHVRGSYLLVEYTMRNGQKATMRVYRNALFVIERTNLVDNTLNLALVPADLLLATPLGQTTTRVASPILEAAGELVMPAILSAKLIWGAFRTTGMAGLAGIQATVGAVLHHSQSAHEDRQQRFEQTRV